MSRLILASSSPRRAQLLGLLNAPFEVYPADIDETLKRDLPLSSAIEDLACRKARAIHGQFPDAWVIGADTLVIVDDEIFGKPQDTAEAVSMLRQLSGRTHQVITGVSILSPLGSVSFAVTTDVDFYSLSEAEIAAYVQTGDCLDKAGTYGIQGYGARFIRQINGDYYAVMGLPVAALYQHLKQLNYPLV